MVHKACAKTAVVRSTNPGAVTIANDELLHTLTNEDVIKQLKTWEAQKSTNAMFKSLMNYIHRVETILYFVEASRN
ncbi:hypothetical protein DPMN_042448 [Dreissena polymorpha]|uniref:Uncharacterized protein n=1 Tax=Dreissena polymorpha TaxID=45954 RepID=A0A9D4D223_DREPO|nr:hypothetical protein DPMN_042448 [Dreissena polymorpha]